MGILTLLLESNIISVLITVFKEVFPSKDMLKPDIKVRGAVCGLSLYTNNVCSQVSAPCIGIVGRLSALVVLVVSLQKCLLHGRQQKALKSNCKNRSHMQVRQQKVLNERCLASNKRCLALNERHLVLNKKDSALAHSVTAVSYFLMVRTFSSQCLKE